MGDRRPFRYEGPRGVAAPMYQRTVTGVDLAAGPSYGVSARVRMRADGRLELLSFDLVPMPAPPRRLLRRALACLLALLLAAAAVATACAAEPAEVARAAGLPDPVPVVVTYVHKDQAGREVYRTYDVLSVPRAAWATRHAETIELDARDYLDKGRVELVVAVYDDPI